jgi:hypothetical protein
LLRVAVERNDCVIVAANDQKCRRVSALERIARQIWASAARNHREDAAIVRCGHERGTRPGARPRNSQLGNRAVAAWSLAQALASKSRFASKGMSKTLLRRVSSSGLRRSRRSVANPDPRSASAT